MVGAQPLHEHAHERRAEPWLDHRRLREDLAKVAIDVGHAPFRRDLGEVVEPGPIDKIQRIHSQAPHPVDVESDLAALERLAAEGKGARGSEGSTAWIHG